MKYNNSYWHFHHCYRKIEKMNAIHPEMGFDIEEKMDNGMYELKMIFRKDSHSSAFNKKAGR
jgi:hypothetical protein